MSYPRCRQCNHAWHGLPCPVFAGTQCICPTSYVEPEESK